MEIFHGVITKQLAIMAEIGKKYWFLRPMIWVMYYLMRLIFRIKDEEKTSDPQV